MIEQIVFHGLVMDLVIFLAKWVAGGLSCMICGCNLDFDMFTDCGVTSEIWIFVINAAQIASKGPLTMVIILNLR